MIKTAAAGILTKLNAFAPVRYLNRGKLLILMYHRFSDGEEEGKTSKRVFERHLAYLRRHYHPLSLSEAVERFSEYNLPARSVVLTVDDGYGDFFDVAVPVLRKFDFPATIYVVTDFVGQNGWIWTDKTRFLLSKADKGRFEFDSGEDRFEFELNGGSSRRAAAGSINSVLKRLNDEDKELKIRDIADKVRIALPETPPAAFAPLTWDKVDELTKNGIEIGSHTASHPILTNVGDERLKKELQDSYSAVAPFSNGRVPHFCYPNGNVSQRERDAVKAAGFASAVTTEIRLCNNKEDIYLLPRIDADPEMHRFVQATSGFDSMKPRGFGLT